MTLLGIAIVGKKNEPLYLCDCTKFRDDDDDNDSSNKKDPADKPDAASADATATTETTTTSTPEDPFGFLQSSSCPGQSLDMEQQFLLHAALDRLEEQVGASKPDGTMPLRKATRNTTTKTAAASSNAKKSSAAGSKLGPPAGVWLGRLDQDEATIVYGYVTATNIKFLALLQHPRGTTSRQTRELVQAQAKAVRSLCTELHGHYIRFVMNPFSQLEDATKLESASLDRNVRHAVTSFRETSTTAATTSVAAA